MPQIYSGEQIKAMRQEQGLPKTELARILGVGTKTLHRWETGESSISTVASVAIRAAIKKVKSSIKKTG
jgi:DNA-binding transcriptional regulator YiaG